jgi:DNA adenine methylase
MKMPHPIPYQGSKRAIARFILPFLSGDLTLIEPFAGSAALSIAAAWYGKAPHFHLNDINTPLIALWYEIIHTPQVIAASYEQLWQTQVGQEREFYDYVRDEFNRTQRPDYLLYLLARCVKASVRYNARGEFNQSPDNRRLGRHPQQMAQDILAVSELLRGKTILTSRDYQEILQAATPKDLIYLDPPYQGVCNSGNGHARNSDQRYLAGIDFAELVQALEYLNAQNIPFILSYDGRTGEKAFGQAIPADLALYHLEIEAGRSSQATLLGRDDITYESIYLSPVLLAQFNQRSQELLGGLVTTKVFQEDFFMNWRSPVIE